MTYQDIDCLPEPEAGEGMRMSPAEVYKAVRSHTVLRTVRERRMVPLEQASLTSGIHQGRLREIEGGTSRPSKAELSALATSLTADVRVFMGVFGYE